MLLARRACLAPGPFLRGMPPNSGADWIGAGMVPLIEGLGRVWGLAGGIRADPETNTTCSPEGEGCCGSGESVEEDEG
jgi:hypothetical protein